MRTTVAVAALLSLAAATTSIAYAEIPGRPKAPLSYDAVADMNYHFARGAPNATVREAQRVLRELGYYAGPVDGIVGPEDRTAVRKFQGAKGLHLSGNLDPGTVAALGLATGEGYASP